MDKLEKLTNTIGNLVLVPSGLNSKLSNEPFHKKKKIVFDSINSESKNYGLWLHTLETFGSHSDWLQKEIENNKIVFENEFNTFFKKTKQ